MSPSEQRVRSIQKIIRQRQKKQKKYRNKEYEMRRYERLSRNRKKDGEEDA